MVGPVIVVYTVCSPRCVRYYAIAILAAGPFVPYLGPCHLVHRLVTYFQGELPLEPWQYTCWRLGILFDQIFDNLISPSSGAH
jgi:hypothetical protein